MRLTENVEHQTRGSQQPWVDEFGISRTFFNQLVVENRIPSLAVMMRIESSTGAGVPLSIWTETVSAEPVQAAEGVEP
ncbi:hypothetical protein [Roseovarius sp. D0-M9]|uniref:hypothetical protein n=1 Tax=Roseovarius sp. D0-M9 TaxID=3127117 RepID=UPI00300FF4B6